MSKFLTIENPRGDILVAWDHVVAILPSDDAGSPLSIVCDAFILSPQGPVPATMQVSINACESVRAQIAQHQAEKTNLESIQPFLTEALEIYRGFAQKNEIPLEFPRMPAEPMEWTRCIADAEAGKRCSTDWGVCLVCQRCKAHGHKVGAPCAVFAGSIAERSRV